MALAIAYVRFRCSRGALISEAFRDSLGSRVEGLLGKAIDILAVVSTVFGVATTVGMGVIQINSGLITVSDLAFGVPQQLAILAGIAVVFLLSALTPLEKGVRYVSDLNMLLAAGLLLFVFFAGPTDFIIAAMTISIIAAFPFMILMVFMVASLLRSLQNERRKIERQNLALRVAVEKLLASEAAGRITSDGCRDKETDIESKRSEE
ncbi:hypothetical protein NOC27_1236 [Nitrosococcus oceani AFC27]|nr:hypothetical protein NOC27_1236 [Nitrosococcus oceani AFC27]GEM19215.1 hypothetical protein NONS58_05940 [Nitrosococcus oceani]